MGLFGKKKKDDEPQGAQPQAMGQYLGAPPGAAPQPPQYQPGVPVQGGVDPAAYAAQMQAQMNDPAAMQAAMQQAMQDPQVQQAMANPQLGQQMAAQQAAAVQQGYAPDDPAIFGGPSNKPLAPDDPLFEPVQGITIEHYGWIAKVAQRQGVSDEAGIIAVAEQNGINGEAFRQAMHTFNTRMAQSQAVGQRFRATFDQY
ncbi:MAG: hypothetical protein MUF83_18455 [Acidimicrobiales bacterium]|nr:hypothetical protein [Acidimicrobiales bacterium]